jgi:hypothetical protein
MVRAMETTCGADGRDWITAIMTRSVRDDNGRSVSGLGPTCRGREQSAIAASALRIPRAEDRESQDSDGNVFRCRFCVVEVERFKLADGTLRSFASRAT